MKRCPALLALALAACGPGEVPEIAVAALEPSLPAECFAPGPAWAPLPEGDVTRREAARLWADNKARFALLKREKRVCRAALATQFPKSVPAARERTK